MIDFTQRGDLDRTYSYDPTQIRDKGINQMRFELGDTNISHRVIDEAKRNGFLSALICDEEYQAIIDNAKTWKSAKLDCLRHIVMQMAYNCDEFTIDGLNIDWTERYERFKQMLDKLEKADNLPSIHPSQLGKDGKGKHYFHYGMLRNPRKF